MNAGRTVIVIGHTADQLEPLLDAIDAEGFVLPRIDDAEAFQRLQRTAPET